MDNRDQAIGIRRMVEARPIQVLAVSSGKGGVGKTNLSVNLGICLSQMGKKVALMDADMGLANVDVLLGIQPKYNLFHVLSGQRTLEEIMIEAPGGLYVVPASSGIQRMSELGSGEQGALIRAFGEIDADLDVLIVDTAAGISSSVLNFVQACQHVIVVVCDEPTSLTDAYALIKLLSREHDVNRFQVVASMVSDDAQGRELFLKLCRVTERYLDVTPQFLGSVPFDAYVRKSVQRQLPVCLSYPGGKASTAFASIARKVDRLPVQGGASGRMEFFVERMLRATAGSNA